MSINYVAVSPDTDIYLSSDQNVELAVKFNLDIYSESETGKRTLLYSGKDRKWVSEERPSFQRVETTADINGSIYADIQYLAMMVGVELHPETTSRARAKAKSAHSKKFVMVKQFYEKGYWNEPRVLNAVDLWITLDEYSEIVGGE